MTFVRICLPKACKPNENIFALSNRQSWESVWTILCYEVGKDRRASFYECRLHSVFKVANEIRFDCLIKIIDRGCDKPGACCCAAQGETRLMRKRESRCGVGEAQEEDVIRIDHGRI